MEDTNFLRYLSKNLVFMALFHKTAAEQGDVPQGDRECHRSVIFTHSLERAGVTTEREGRADCSGRPQSQCFISGSVPMVGHLS